MGHGHHEAPYKIPDYKIYKVENVPKLLQVKKALESQGLRDPWLRNEVWRYDAKVYGTEASRAKGVFLRGFRWGFLAFVITAAGGYLLDKKSGGTHGHH